MFVHHVGASKFSSSSLALVNLHYGNVYIGSKVLRKSSRWANDRRRSICTYLCSCVLMAIRSTGPTKFPLVKPVNSVKTYGVQKQPSGCGYDMRIRSSRQSSTTTPTATYSKPTGIWRHPQTFLTIWRLLCFSGDSENSTLTDTSRGLIRNGKLRRHL